MTYRITDKAEIAKALSWLSEYLDSPIQAEYYDARTVDKAVSLLNEFGKEAKIIAGGVDLISLMKNKTLRPGALINIKNIPQLSQIIETASGISIGSLSLIRDIERSSLIKSKYPMLFEAARSIGSPQVRNMATIGGNLCQEVRCWYYRRSPVTGISFNCRRKTEKGVCHAIGGENQYHAIIGGPECFAVCPSDMATVLLALDARIKTVNTSGGRLIPVDEFYTTLGNILEPDELITAIEVPKVSPETKQRFIKFRKRQAIDFAIVSVAAVIKLDGNTVADARIVLGGVAPKPYRAVKAEEYLIGATLTKSTAIRAAGASVADARPLSQNGYKIPIIETLVKRAILE